MKDENKVILEELKNAIKNFDSDAAVKTAKKALEAGMDPLKIMENGLVKGLREVGDLFAKGELFITHLVAAAEAMKSAMEILEPALLAKKTERKALGKVVIGTVAGDIHSIGKRIVSCMLIAHGFDVYDIGEDAPAELFIKKAREVGADVIGASALLTTTLPAQKDLAEAIARSDLKVKYIVGGAAATEEWAKKIGAFYAEDSISAVEVIKRLVGVKGEG